MVKTRISNPSHNVAKVEVEGSNPFARSKNCGFFTLWILGIKQGIKLFNKKTTNPLVFCFFINVKIHLKYNLDPLTNLYNLHNLIFLFTMIVSICSFGALCKTARQSFPRFFKCNELKKLIIYSLIALTYQLYLRLMVS